MSTLWTALAALVAIALLVVLAFNLLQGRQRRLRDAWRERLAGRGDARTRTPAKTPGAPKPPAGPKAPAARSPAPAPVPPPAERVEPTFGALDATPSDEPSLDADAAIAQAEAASTPAADAAPVAPAPPPRAVPTPAGREPGAVLDARLDCIVDFAPPAPVGAERLLAAISTMRRAGSKPIAVEVDAGDGAFRAPHAASGALQRVRAGVLLANRHGPLNAMEFSEFLAAMQSLGRAIGVPDAPMPEMTRVLEHARQLDEACAQLDAVIGLNVETPQALSPAELAALAGGLGLAERGNTRWAALGDEGEVLFSLALGERAEQLTLLLDVPRAPPGAEPWGRMVGCAMLCAERTGGRVVDDAGRPLTEAAAIEVARQLEQRYRTLADAGLDAGSPAALRVFN